MFTRLQILRKKLKLSQKEFGEKLGVSRDVVSNAELGRVDMKPIFVSHLCSTFNVNETWLRTGEGEMLIPEDRENALFQWVGEVLADESESFRRRYLQALMTLTPADWERAEQFMRRLIDIPDTGDF